MAWQKNDFSLQFVATGNVFLGSASQSRFDRVAVLIVRVSVV
jgi:hypothetical protein